MHEQGYDLGAVATEVIDGSPDADVADLGLELVNTIDPDHFDDAVQIMATSFVAAARRARRAKVLTPEKIPAKTSPVQRPAASRRIEAATIEWQKFLDAEEYVPSLNYAIAIRDATYQQVTEMVRRRNDMATKNAAIAGALDKIATHMKALRAATVADLPRDLLNRLNGSKEIE